MNYEEVSEFAMNIIANAGMARSMAMEAIANARNGEFDKAEESLKQAEEIYLVAHKFQTELISMEASQEKSINLNLIMVHAQDHLTMALITKDNAKEFINLYKRLEG